MAGSTEQGATGQKPRFIEVEDSHSRRRLVNLASINNVEFIQQSKSSSSSQSQPQQKIVVKQSGSKFELEGANAERLTHALEEEGYWTREQTRGAGGMQGRNS